MAPRPTEVKAVRALLEGPASDVQELAARVIETLDEARASRPTFIIVKAHRGDLTVSYGPFPTKLKAEQAIEKGNVPIIEGESYGIGKLWSEKHALDSVAASDAPVVLTKVTKDKGRHPTPYGAHDVKSRRRYSRMSKTEKLQAYEKRLS